MRGWRGVVSGSLALVVLEVFLSTGGFGSGLLAYPGKLAQRFLDPAIPAIPDRSGGSTAASPALAYGMGTHVRTPAPTPAAGSTPTHSQN